MDEDSRRQSGTADHAYRPEIDGLRAIAVFAVVIYHAKLSWFWEGEALSGGFLGVDIFFVISGYLITSIILGEHAEGRFTLRRFYERRARRILPALFLVIFATLPFVAAFLVPKALKDYSGSGLSALLFSSNFWFWTEDAYTAESSLLKPLLHTWSLAVEEQFYLFFPLIVAAIWRWKRSALVWVLVAIFLVSLVIAEITSAADPRFAFYLIPSRAWELMAGSLLVLVRPGARMGKRPVATALAATGLALLASPLVLMNDSWQLPSLWTFPTVLGTALVISFAQGRNPIALWLSHRPVVYVGKVSYSFYLWHFPVFAIARIAIGEPSNFLKLVLIALSLSLAALSYVWVEQPFRRVLPMKFVARVLAVAFVVLLLVEGALYASGGWPERFGTLAPAFREQSEGWLRDEHGLCTNRLFDETCTFPGEAGQPTLLLFGDSIAREYSATLSDIARKRGFGYREVTRGGCKFIAGLQHASEAKLNVACAKGIADLQAYVSTTPDLILVYAAALRVSDADSVDGQTPQPEQVVTLMDQTLTPLLGSERALVLLHPLPVFPASVAQYYFSALKAWPIWEWQQRIADINLNAPYPESETGNVVFEHLWTSLAGSENVLRVDPQKEICGHDAGVCHSRQASTILFSDNMHPNGFGVALARASLERAIDEAARQLR